MGKVFGVRETTTNRDVWWWADERYSSVGFRVSFGDRAVDVAPSARQVNRKLRNVMKIITLSQVAIGYILDVPPSSCGLV